MPALIGAAASFSPIIRRLYHQSPRLFIDAKYSPTHEQWTIKEKCDVILATLTRNAKIYHVSHFSSRHHFYDGHDITIEIACRIAILPPFRAAIIKNAADALLILKAGPIYFDADIRFSSTLMRQGRRGILLKEADFGWEVCFCYFIGPPSARPQASTAARSFGGASFIDYGYGSFR